MRILLAMGMLCLLVRAPQTMDAAAQACRLFVTSVLPGLFPYMTLSLMLTSRFAGKLPPGLFLLLGWGGGSPTGARLLPTVQGGRRERVRLAVSVATMSPMFLLGTVGTWLDSPTAGLAALVSVLAGGYVTGLLAGKFNREDAGTESLRTETGPMLFGAAVETAAGTMLLVCGTMVMLCVAASLAAQLLPEAAALPVTMALEVTTGVAAIADAPWPLALRTAVIAGAAGFGGLAGILQNRTVYEEGFLPLWAQIGWQAVHGAVSFLLALGMMRLIGA